MSDNQGSSKLRFDLACVLLGRRRLQAQKTGYFIAPKSGGPYHTSYTKQGHSKATESARSQEGCLVDSERCHAAGGRQNSTFLLHFFNTFLHLRFTRCGTLISVIAFQYLIPKRLQLRVQCIHNFPPSWREAPRTSREKSSTTHFTLMVTYFHFLQCSFSTDRLEAARAVITLRQMNGHIDNEALKMSPARCHMCGHFANLPMPVGSLCHTLLVSSGPIWQHRRTHTIGSTQTCFRSKSASSRLDCHLNSMFRSLRKHAASTEHRAPSALNPDNTSSST